MSYFVSTTACQKVTSAQLFGLADNPPEAANLPRPPAQLNEISNESSDWLLTVNNAQHKQVIFNAVDGCVSFLRGNGAEDFKCDGVLRYDACIHFVELKDRNGGQFIADAIRQLESTIFRFRQAGDLRGFTQFKAQISNKQRPKFNNNTAILSAKFRDTTHGFILDFKSQTSI